MANTRDIVRRIKSVKNTKKITKAMEMVSSSKMRKAVGNVTATRPYSGMAWNLIQNVAKKTDIDIHPLLHKRDEIKKIAVVLITSNRGLCGSFNSTAVKKTVEYIRTNEAAGAEVEAVVMGKKGANGLTKFGKKVVADFEKADVLSEVAEIRPLSKMLLDEYLAGNYDKVVLVYTDYISALNQICRIKQLLPIESTPDEMLGSVGKDEVKEEATNYEYLFEPEPKKILDNLLPRLLEVQIYQAILESNASEHSARMMAMRNASDAAGDMINELTLAYNQARQAAITSEIAEIAGGKAALE